MFCFLTKNVYYYDDVETLLIGVQDREIQDEMRL